MILKYKTIRDGKVEQWNYIDGIEEASTFVDEEERLPCIRIKRKDFSEMVIGLHQEAYLLNDHGVTIERIRL